MAAAVDDRSPGAAIVGVAEQGNSAFLATVSTQGELMDRRRVKLTVGLPTHPYHHEGAWAMGRYLDSPWARPVSLADAVAIIKQVEERAALGARDSLASLAADVPIPILAIALRTCPALPATIEARIADHRAQLVADSVMYRQALAAAAVARGWAVCWYEPERVPDEAAQMLSGRDVRAYLNAMGRVFGPPWQAKHKLAAAAALAAARRVLPDALA